MGKRKPRRLTLETVVGRQLRALREGAGVARELLAVVSKDLLGWNVGTLELIESGRRRLGLGELYLLPFLLTRVVPLDFHPQCERPLPCALHRKDERHRRAFEVQDLFPDEGMEQLNATPYCWTYPHEWHRLVQEQGRLPDEKRPLYETDQDQQLQHYDEVTLRAAKALRAPLSLVAEVAQRLWGRSFLIERDARLQAMGMAAGRTQMRRGHVSRKMMEELKQSLKSKKTTRPKRRGRRR